MNKVDGLMPKVPGRQQSIRHREEKVAVAKSDMRWCSDGLDIKFDLGQATTATFAKTAVTGRSCSRGLGIANAYRVSRCARCPESVVDKSFGSVEGILVDHKLEFL